MIDANQVGAVFVANNSRLARLVLDFEVFRVRAALHNTLLYSDGRLADLANSADTIASQMSALFSQFENRKRTEVMTQSRLAKAKRGDVVSRLPVGWIKGPDGKYDFDPETRDTVKLIIDTFWQKRSARGTAIALAQAGVQIPYRIRQRLYLGKPTVGRLTSILTHPAYVGIYVYGKSRSQAGGPVLARGQSRRIKLPEERWITTYNHHPAYMTQEQQQEIKTILKKNNFGSRHRAGRDGHLPKDYSAVESAGNAFPRIIQATAIDTSAHDQGSF